MIPRDTVERIFSAARIEEVVGDYVSLKKRGANLIGLCPFHDEKTGSFTVSPSKGIYKCFGCGKSGHVAGFLMEIEQCTYAEALRMLAKKYNIEVEERELTEEEQQRNDDRESMFVLNEFAAGWFEMQLWDSREGQAVGLAYFRERGLRDDIIRKFRLGYSPDKSLLQAAAKEKGFTEKYLLNDSQNAPYVGTGLCLKSEDGRLYDRFHSRVIFPFFSRAGKVVGFAGRILKKNDKVGKYVNSPTSPLFEKHNELYGLYQARQAISRLNSCYLVEGQMDVISMHQAGIENVVSSGGTSLTKPQIQLIHRFTSNIVILYDGDKAGIKAALRGIDMVLEEGIHVKIVLLPEGEDPDSFARSHNASDVVEYIEGKQTDFISFKTALLREEAGTDPMRRSELIHSVAQSIAVIPDAITRQVYMQDCAVQLNVSETLLTHEVSKLRNGKAAAALSGQEHTQPEHSEKDNDNPSGNPPADNRQEKDRTADEQVFNRNMLNLLRLMVRYGEQPLFTDEQGQTVQCGEYILDDLQNDRIEPRLEAHKRLMDEYAAHCHEVGFCAETFFLHHADNGISTLAAHLLTDRYQLSRIFSRQSISENVVQEVKQQTDRDILPELTSQLLLEIKFTVINERIAAMQAAVRKAEEEGDWDSVRLILQQQPRLMAIRSQLCKELGNRIITP